MKLNDHQHNQLKEFFNRTNFAEQGGVITDLDGTAIFEFEGRYSVPKSVELALEKIYSLGRPVVINTLRFPLSVINTFGKEWYRISNTPIPTVLMNGSQLGYLVKNDDGIIGYQEITAFPLIATEINDVVATIRNLVSDGIENLLVFYYPREWKKGEIIWTTSEDKIKMVQKKYLSASGVYSSSVEQLHTGLLAEEICMIFLLVQIPQDKLMAYQHTKKSNFFTRKGVDKLSGAKEIARHLKFDLQNSVGAGDSEMDTFLKGVGLAVHVGNNLLPYNGIFSSMHVGGSSELGELLFELSIMQKTATR